MAFTEKEIRTFEDLCFYIAKLIEDISMNVVTETQSSMVEHRLKKRLCELGDLTPVEYMSYLNDNYDLEVKELISLLTTHHTFFFREFVHFEFILKNLDEIVKAAKSRGDQTIRILSVACSKGHEVYSLAMFFRYHLDQSYPDMDFKIIGNDIDEKSIEYALNGVFPYKEIKSIPSNYILGNWQRGTGEISEFVKIKKELKQKCSFSVMNIMHPETSLSNEKFDLILCRNVFIYFDNEVVEKTVTKLKQYLGAKGYFITGLCESLSFLKQNKYQYGPCVYRFDEFLDHSVPVFSARREVKSGVSQPIRVLVVDDSLSIRKILSRIFKSDPHFELVGTAKNGVEAEKFIKENKVDAMTLDIHMPEMDGVEYLRRNFSSKHPHVVVVSSASREDMTYTQETLRLGASDFVEKPNLNNLKEREDEIKMKIKTSFYVKKTNENNNEVMSSFTTHHVINEHTQKVRIFCGTNSSLKQISLDLPALKSKQPFALFVLDLDESLVDGVISNLNSLWPIYKVDSSLSMKEGVLNVISLSSLSEESIEKLNEFKARSVSVFSNYTRKMESFIKSLGEKQLVLEECQSDSRRISEEVDDVFPATSFFHIGTEYLSKAEK